MADTSEAKAEFRKALATAKVFSDCVEFITHIHTTFRGNKHQELLLCRLGIEQARLLIWGGMVGIDSPPASTGITHAVPLEPGALNPDPTTPIYFNARNARLEEPETADKIQGVLKELVDIFHGNQMQDKYGLKAVKALSKAFVEQPPLDLSRLEGFREKYVLLHQVATSFANLSDGVHKGAIRQDWTILDSQKFSRLVDLFQVKTNDLVTYMGLQEGVKRGMRIDIRALGWHPAAEVSQTAKDKWKLRLMQQVCETEYPENLDVINQALANLSEDFSDMNSYSRTSRRHSVGVEAPAAAPKPAIRPGPPVTTQSSRPFSLKFWRKSSKRDNDDGRRASVAVGANDNADGSQANPRSLSDTPVSRGFGSSPSSPVDDEPQRSKSIHVMGSGTSTGLTSTTAPPMPPMPSKVVPVATIEETKNEQQGPAFADTELSKQPTVQESSAGGGDHLAQTATMTSSISRHDQFHGLGRLATKQ